MCILLVLVVYVRQGEPALSEQAPYGSLLVKGPGRLGSRCSRANAHVFGLIAQRLEVAGQMIGDFGGDLAFGFSAGWSGWPDGRLLCANRWLARWSATKFWQSGGELLPPD